MASDGQVTSSSSGGPVRHAMPKIEKLGSDKLWAASGSVGLIQKVAEAFQTIPAELLNKSLNDAQLRQTILQMVYQIRRSELERHRGLYGPGRNHEAQVADIVLAEYQNGNVIIWHIFPDCQDIRQEFFGYGCSGSGDIFAHTLLKHHKVRELKVKQGALVAYRVIRDAIDVGAFGLGEPIDIWIIDGQGIKQMSRDEMLALRDAYSTWVEAELEMFRKLFPVSEGSGGHDR